jgi:hypothetical protein
LGSQGIFECCWALEDLLDGDTHSEKVQVGIYDRGVIPLGGGMVRSGVIGGMNLRLLIGWICNGY